MYIHFLQYIYKNKTFEAIEHNLIENLQLAEIETKITELTTNAEESKTSIETKIDDNVRSFGNL